MARRLACSLLFLFVVSVLGCNTTKVAPPAAASADSATFDPDGTAHITRVIPMPATVSPEAQTWLASLNKSTPGPEDLATRRKRTDEWRAKQSAAALELFPVVVKPTTIAGVQTDILTPFAPVHLSRLPEPFDPSKERILINLHGGGFNSDSGSIIEGAPICNLAKIKVVSVYYRLAPENPFPAPVDDVVAVYKELLKTYKPRHIGIFGTSAGAILTAEVAVKLKQLGLPLPGALGLFSVLTDYSRPSDSHELFTLNGFPGSLQPQDPHNRIGEEYARDTDRKNPVLSPLYADLKGMPPTLLVTSTRDLLLSDTAIFHRALLRANVDSQLVVFEALPHAFWYHFQLPETTEALHLMANFFNKKLSH